MTRTSLSEQILLKQSFLCVGLDTDINKLPSHLRSNKDGVFLFNKAIIDATKELCVSYKINTAFYEAMGVKGWEAIQKTVDYIPSTHFTIADAKRGDIGNTASQYAKAFFEVFNFDAITVAPYMGEDSIRPFMEYDDKWTIVLGLTSNAGSRDFEQLKLSDEQVNGGSIMLYEKVLQTVSSWGTPDNLMFVAGATRAADFKKIRSIIPDHFLLVPGVGTQGGSLADVVRHGITDGVGLLVNASRAIIYAGSDEDFASEAKLAALQYQQEMSSFLVK